MNAKISMSLGAEYPYDVSDAWWDIDDEVPPPPDDWAHSAARGVLADLQSRGAIKQVLEGIDENIRKEIVASVAEIIRVAASCK